MWRNNTKMEVWWLLDAEKLKVFSIATVFWSLLFAQVRYLIKPNLGTPEKDADVQNRLISFVHGIFCIVYSTTRVL